MRKLRLRGAKGTDQRERKKQQRLELLAILLPTHGSQSLSRWLEVTWLNPVMGSGQA
jgi:hypothetical protein